MVRGIGKERLQVEWESHSGWLRAGDRDTYTSAYLRTYPLFEVGKYGIIFIWKIFQKIHSWTLMRLQVREDLIEPRSSPDMATMRTPMITRARSSQPPSTDLAIAFCEKLQHTATSRDHGWLARVSFFQGHPSLNWALQLWGAS